MKIKYVAEDGKEFTLQSECIAYEDQFLGKAKAKYEAMALGWLKNSYTGKRLSSKYDNDEYGLWVIYGEDSNCDFGGHHYEPELETVEGKFIDVVKHAVSIKRFFTWGSGGNIKKIEYKSIV